MKKIIVTLTNEKNSFSYDLEVPVDLEFEHLYNNIIAVLCTQNSQFDSFLVTKRLYIQKLQRYMHSGETLSTCGVYNGDYLLLG